jgi:hypothetical protein
MFLAAITVHARFYYIPTTILPYLPSRGSFTQARGQLDLEVCPLYPLVRCSLHLIPGVGSSVLSEKPRATGLQTSIQRTV